MINCFMLKCPDGHEVFWAAYDGAAVSQERAMTYLAHLSLTGFLNDRCTLCGKTGEDLSHSEKSIEKFTDITPIADSMKSLRPGTAIVIVTPNADHSGVLVRGIELTTIHVGSKPQFN